MDQDALQQVPVCIDGRLLASGATGVASYGRAMLEGLTATGAPPLVLDDARRGVFGGASSIQDTIVRQMRARMPLSLRLRQEDGRLHQRDVFRLAHARFAATGRLLGLRAPGPGGIMHWTYPIPAWIEGWVNLYTVHDVIPLTDPALSPLDPDGLRRRLAAVVAVADRIVTVSQEATAAIAAALAIDPSAISNCGAAVSHFGEVCRVLPGGLRPEGYLLYCGLAEPRKNLLRLVTAWETSGVAEPLVLVGPDFADVPQRAGMIVLPYQPRDVLAALIRDARALLLPSLAEGFGLPAVEAMTLGTPVLTADRGALAEIAGGAAVLVDPYDVRAISAGIRLLCSDARLRAELVIRGRHRAAAFTPAAFGMRLRALHSEFAGDSRLAS